MTDICCDVICEQQGCLHTRLATELAELRTECAALRAEIVAWWTEHHDDSLLFNRLMQADPTLAKQMQEALAVERKGERS